MEKSSLSIKSWSEDDKPREKLMLKGKNALSDAELIAILIGSGSRNETAVELSKRILASVGNNLKALGKLSVLELCTFKGIGEAKAISIIAAAELGRRRNSEEAEVLKKITASKEIFNIMQPILGELFHEEFWVLFMNNDNKVIHKSQLSKGGMTGTIVDNRMIFKIALERNATSIILCHNHPSGNLKPSDADKAITKSIKQAGMHLNIAVLDHIIVSENGYYSFADENIL